MYTCNKCQRQFETRQGHNGHMSWCGIKRKTNFCLRQHNPWNKGKHGIYSEEYRKRISESNKGKRHKVTEITKRKISDSAKKNKISGGYRYGSGRGQKCWYESKIAGRVFLDSSYELRFAKFLDKFEIEWKRNTKKFPYVYLEKQKNYIPDFYLVKSNEYVEIKGFKTKQDEAKWSQFKEKLVILFGNDLRKIAGAV